MTTTKRVDGTTKLPEEGGQATRDVTNQGLIPPKGIALYLQDGTLIATRDEDELFLGRKVDDTSDPVIDLIPFGAFQSGVSRRHASVIRTNDGFDIMDLNSTNGTFVNGDRLVSSKRHPLISGSELTLGRLHVIIFFARPEKKD